MNGRIFRYLGSIVVVAGVSGCFESTDNLIAPLDAGGDASQFPNQPSEAGTGPATAQVSVDTLDIGLADCGGQASAPHSVALTNSGGLALTWSAALTQSPDFVLVEPASGTVKPGETGNIAVRANPIPKSAVAGAVKQGTLTIQTNDPARPTIIVPLKVTAAGATFTLVPGTAAFGDFPVNAQAPDLPLVLKNVGNRAVLVSVKAPQDPQFAVGWKGSPAPLEVAPNSALESLVARFKPTRTTPSASSADIDVQGAVCGESVQSIAMSGQGTNAVVGVSPGSLDYGSVNCGSAAPLQNVTVVNTGNAPVNFNATLQAAMSSPYTIQPTSGTLAPGARMAIAVTPKAIPAVSLTSADLYADTLIVTTNASGDSPHNVALHQTARGARLVASTGAVTFGDVPVGTNQSAAFAINNSGNVAANVTFAASGTGFSVSPGSASAAAGGAASGTTVFTPSVSGPAQGLVTVGVSPSDVLCAPLPAPISLSANATNGSVALSAQSLDFGLVNCGGQGTARSLTIRNSGNGAFTFNAALGLGGTSPYTISPASGSVAPNGSATVTITPKAIPQSSAVPGNYADSLTVTTTVAGDTPHTVALSEGAQGAILSFAPARAIDFGQVALGSAPSASVSIVNDGNLPASVSLTTGDALFVASPSGGSVGVRNSLQSTVTFRASDVNPHSGALTMSAVGAVLCSPLPAALAIRGQGTNGAVTISPTSLSFGRAGMADCGSTPAAQNITVANSGNAAFDITGLSLSNTAYVVATPNGTRVNPGSSVTVVVTPPAIPATIASIVPNGFGGSLRITTSNVGTNSFDVPLNLTAFGAILSYPAGFDTSLRLADTMLGSTSPRVDAPVLNGGNSAATFYFSPSDPQFNAIPVAPGQQVPVQVNGTPGSFRGGFTFTPTGRGRQLATASLFVARGTPLCGPLPATLNLLGIGRAAVPGVNRTDLDFGTVSCGSQGRPQTFLVTNGGDAPFNFTISTPTNFTISPTSGTVPVNSNGVAITVTPNQIVPGPAITTQADSLAETLTVTPQVTGAAPLTVRLHETPSGGIIIFNPESHNFGTILASQRQLGTMRGLITNQGSVVVPFTLSVPAQIRGETIQLTPTTGEIGPGGSTNFSLGYLPSALAIGTTVSRELVMGPPVGGAFPPMCRPVPTFKFSADVR